jgi:predicted PurR-regulated permease PerM
MKGTTLVWRRRSHLLWHVTFGFLALMVLFLAVRYLAPVLMPLVAAGGVAYFFDPLVTRLGRRGWPRSVGAGLVLIGGALLLIGAVAVLVPLVAADLRQFAGRLPAMAQTTLTWVHDRLGLEVDDWSAMVDQVQGSLRAAAAKAGVPILSGLATALGSLAMFVLALVELLLIPVFAFYFLVDWPAITRRVHALVPPRHRQSVDGILAEIDDKLSGWVRGQLTVMAVLALLYAVGLSVLGIQLAVPVGLLAGVLTFIPYVGAVVGLGLALLMVVLDWHGPGPLVGVLGVFAVLHALESWVLTPKLVGAKVGLGEAAALFAVVAGGHLLGFVGMMLAIPLAACAAVLVRRAVGYYERSQFYQRGAEVAPEEPRA